MQSVQVIIPYFQRESGLLRTALTSVFRQEGVDRPKIYVVDDESPSPPQLEIEALPAEWRDSIVLVHQKNRGPAAARNRALDLLPDDTEYVAFLDSDDLWRPRHLDRALKALQCGVDFYFCERWIMGTELTGSEWRRDKYLPPLLPLLPDLGIFRIEEGFFRLVWSSLVPTSGVVYRYAKFRQHRFNEELRWAEDYLFHLTILQTTRSMAFDTQPGYDVGRGVSVSHAEWGSLEHFRGTGDTQKALRYIIAHFDLPPLDRLVVSETLAKSRRYLATEILHHMRRGRLRAVAPILRADPAVVGQIGLALVRFFLKQPAQSA